MAVSSYQSLENTILIQQNRKIWLINPKSSTFSQQIRLEKINVNSMEKLSTIIGLYHES